MTPQAFAQKIRLLAEAYAMDYAAFHAEALEMIEALHPPGGPKHGILSILIEAVRKPVLQDSIIVAQKVDSLLAGNG
jgi:hypothetical protein